MHYQQLVNARGMLFPGEGPFPEQMLAALVPDNFDNSNHNTDMDEVDLEEGLGSRRDMFSVPSDTRRPSFHSQRSKRRLDFMLGENSDVALGTFPKRSEVDTYPKRFTVSSH